MRVVSIFLWHWLTRAVMFWSIFGAIVYYLDLYLDKLDIALILERISGGVKLFQGTLVGTPATLALEGLSKTDFIFSLALAIIAIAAALAATFFILHVVVIVFTMWSLRMKIRRPKTREAFAKDYDQTIYSSLEKSSLLGHAWREYDETLVKPSPLSPPDIKNTVRPQSFINVSIARDRLFGLKMMPSIPGYFVAVGLLLTFTGIVLALYKAGAASSAEDVGVMQKAMTELLQIASFKFATSIAGLGCSLVLSIIFKIYMVWIEASFHKFCEAAETKLKYVPPQALALEMNEAAKEQRDQLKEINSDKFFTQMGQTIQPQIQSAFSTAMAPINASIADALGQISKTSQSGVSDMLAQFSTSVQGSAGTELRELAETLKAMQVTLAETQNGVKGSGEDFARRMSDAAENLNRLVADAAKSMDDGANKNRDGLSAILKSMQDTFEKASARVDDELGRAAGGASERIEAAMGRVLEKLEGQVNTLSGGMASLDANLREGVNKTQEQIKTAQENAVSAVAEIATSSAEAMRSGLAEAISTIRSEIDRFETALSESRSALEFQASAIGEATSQTRIVADSFEKTAGNIRMASQPLLQSGEKIAAATSNFETALTSAVAALTTSQEASEQLANSIGEQGSNLVTSWQNYDVRFARIDEALAKSVTDLAAATVKQGDTLSNYAQAVDQHLGHAVRQLAASVNDIDESLTEIATSVADLKSALQTAAE